MLNRGSWLLAATFLAGLAQGQAIESPERMAATNVCDYIAGVTAEASLDGDRVGLFVSDGLVWKGVLDLDGDGTRETVTPSSAMGTMGGDGYDITRADGTTLYVGRESGTDSDMPDGFGGAFLNFAGRWFYVVFAWDSAAFPVGTIAFEKGVTPVTACRFTHTVEEKMGLANLARDEDASWCWGTAREDAKANRLKPAATLNPAEEAALAEALTAQAQAAGSSLQGFSGTEIYRPTIGPFAGLDIWKVNNSSGAGRGCAGQFLQIVSRSGDGDYSLADDPRQRLLNQLVAESDELGVYNCHAEIDLVEVNERFFVERHAGSETPTIDPQLLHFLVEPRDGKPYQACASFYRVTPKVSDRNPAVAP